MGLQGVTITVFIIIFIIAGLGLLIRKPPFWLVERAAVRRMKKLQLALEDGLHAVLTGTGSPMPDINRAGPSVGIKAGEKLFIVDTGVGSERNFHVTGLNTGRVDAVFITHFHSDHIGGLGETMLLRWTIGGNEEKLPVYGPPGIKTIVEGFRIAYEQDKGYRVAHHDEGVMPPGGAGGEAVEFDLGMDPMASKVIYDQEGVKVTAFNVNHAPVFPAVGYKFEYKDRSIVISGDTAYSENLVQQSKGTDLLICDALNKKLVNIIHKNADLLVGKTIEDITSDIQSYHMTPEEAAKIGDKSGASFLILTHIIPPLQSPVLNNAFMGNAKKYFQGKIAVGRDGMLISLPAKSKLIKTRQLF